MAAVAAHRLFYITEKDSNHSRVRERILYYTCWWRANSQRVYGAYTHIYKSLHVYEREKEAAQWICISATIQATLIPFGSYVC